MDATDIQTLLQIGERLTFECKKAETGIPKSVWETYSSFANTVGGIIVLGITEHSNFSTPSERFEVTGVSHPEKLRKEFFDTLNSNKVNRNILSDKDIEIVDYHHHSLLCIQVPQADYRQRPIYLNGNMMNGSFKRNYEGDYHCTEDDVKAMVRDANDSGSDSVLIENYGMDDIDPATLTAYRNRFRTSNPDHLWNDCDDKTFLQNMGGYIKNRNTGREGLSLAGLLMFGKGVSISERFDNIRMDYLDFTNLPPESRWSDRLTYDGRWENNLYNFFTRVLAKLVSDIKRPFMMQGTDREDDTPLHKAIREALTNLIIHADYMITGVLKVEKYNDRFVFSNPGSLKLPIQDIYEGGHSQARNPRIQTMLRMIGIGENIGSGFPVILNACQQQNWRRPLLCERADLRLVELTISMSSLISPECINTLVDTFGKEYKDLNSEEQLILATALTEESVTSQTIQLLLDKNSLEVGKFIYPLVEKGMLLSTNKRRWTTYQINPSYPNEKKHTPPPSKQKIKKENITQRIIAFCHSPRTLKEIAEKLGFSDRFYMKRIYIDPILNKKLQMTNTDNKTSSKQTYRAIEKP